MHYQIKMEGRKNLATPKLRENCISFNVEYKMLLSSLSSYSRNIRFPRLNFKDCKAKTQKSNVNGLAYCSIKGEYHGVKALSQENWIPFAYCSSKYEFKERPNAKEIGFDNFSSGIGIFKKFERSNLEIFFDVPRTTIGFHMLTS